MKLKYLVTGTGRCGTVYMARLLTAIGANCGHEAIFTHLGLGEATERLRQDESKLRTSMCSVWNHVTKESSENWFQPVNIVGESSYMAAPYLDEPILDGVKVIHLVRNPLEVLSSWVLDIHFFNPSTTTIGHFRKFIYSHVPIIEEEKTEIEKACRYLIEWNKIIENTKREKILVRIEDFPYVKLVNFIEESTNLEAIDSLREKKVNSWKVRRRDLTLKDIPGGDTKKEFVAMIKKYGYIDKAMLLI